MNVDEVVTSELLGRVLSQDEDELARRWVALQQERTIRGENFVENEVEQEAAAVLHGLRTGLQTDLPAAELIERHAPLHEAVSRLSVRRARAGMSPSTIAMAVLSWKQVFWEAVARHSDDLATQLSAAMLVNQVLDAAWPLSFEAYTQGREEIIRAQHQQMMELSTPVIRLWRHVLAVPLIGTLDSARTQMVMNGLLEGIQTQEARVAIIDITGVPTVDTFVAQHLLQTVGAVRLMGAECLISGIRPSIAQTITQLGIDLSTIVTRATLADALAEAIRLTDDQTTPDLPAVTP